MSNDDYISCYDAGQFVDYFPETGEFIWKRRDACHFRAEKFQKIWNTKFAGKSAGCFRADGYRVIRLHDKLYLGHRLAWALHFGEWPDKFIDHIDGNPSNNMIENLRVVDRYGNNTNCKIKGNNTSGCTGVWWHSANRKWIAEIKSHGKKMHIGSFANLEDAAEARKKAELANGFHPNHGRLASIA